MPQLPAFQRWPHGTGFFEAAHSIRLWISRSGTSGAYMPRNCTKMASTESPLPSKGRTTFFICSCRWPGGAGDANSLRVRGGMNGAVEFIGLAADAVRLDKCFDVGGNESGDSSDLDVRDLTVRRLVI